MTRTCFVGTPRDFATSSILFCTAPSVALLGTTEGVFAAVWVLTAVWTKKSICRLSAVVFLSVITTSLALWKKTKLCSTIRSCSLDVGSLLTYWCLWKWQTFGRRCIQINFYKRKLTHVFKNLNFATHVTSTHSMAARSRLLCAALTCWAHSPVLVQCRFTESATDCLKSLSLALNWNKVMRCCWKIWHNKNGIVKYFLRFCSGNVYRVVPWAHPDSKVHGTNMGPIWVLSAPDGPHVSPINLAIKAKHLT